MRKLVAVVSILVLAGCSVNPVTGERELTLVSESQAIAMGRQSAAQVSQSIGLVQDEALQNYVASVGQKLAADTVRPGLPWQFQVVDDPTPNAFALPGGFIFVTRGLMDLMTSEAQLAAVLGHEIGHVTARHSVVQLSRQKLANIGLGLGMVLSPEVRQFGDLLGQGLGLLFLKYGRDDERQADKLGFKYMVDEGYDPHQMVSVFEALHSSTVLSGSSPLPDWLSSHPADPERIASAQQRITALPSTATSGAVGRDTYLSHLDGVAYGENPRKGFFRDEWFYQPTLKFKFRIPIGWMKQNLADAVEAVSPEHDAAIRLTIAKAATPQMAARAFAAQQGIDVLNVERPAFNNGQEVAMSFQAATPNGTVRGYAAYISLHGTTYELLAFAPAAAFAQRQRQLNSVISSFSTITEPAILDVAPAQVNIVRLDSALTLKQFESRHPSSIGLDELAVINQVADPNKKLPAGTLMKQIVGGI